MAPLIGVTPCRALADCLEAIRRVGGDPRPLDFATDQPGHVTKDLSGLLLSHGGDIDPTLYGEEQDMAVQDGLRERERDTYELEIVCRALDVDLPMLGICRGIQVLNVACGGTLIQAIRTEVPGALEHQIREPRYAIAHEVWITKGSRLRDVMGEPLGQGDTCPINSRHHQAIKRVADGFAVSATAPDGIIEAIERPASRFCIGVQWHPENFWRTGEFRPLFEALIEACRER